MVKVATPILYESALDELNRVRPLLLGDRSRLSVDLPVLSKNPVGTGRPIIGKLVRCDEQGALLNNKGNSFKNYELISLTLSSSNPTKSIEFSQRIFGSSIQAGKLGVTPFCYLTNSSYLDIVKIFTQAGIYYINLTGFTLYFKGFGSGPWFWYLDVYGFY